MRIHFGISFSWSKIKKYVIPLILAFLAYFSLNSLFIGSTLASEVKIDDIPAAGDYELRNSSNLSYKTNIITINCTPNSSSGNNSCSSDTARLDFYTSGDVLGAYQVGLYMRYAFCMTAPFSEYYAANYGVFAMAEDLNFTYSTTQCTFSDNSTGYMGYLDFFISPVNDYENHYSYTNKIDVMVAQTAKVQLMYVSVNDEDYHAAATDMNQALVNSTHLIIENDNANTQRIIDNNNLNTNRIVNSQEEIKDAITDDTIDIDTADGFFSDFDDSDYGLSDIIKAPLLVIRSLTVGDTCRSLDFNVLGSDVSFPSGCILWNEVPSNVENIFYILVYGLVAYVVGTDLVKLINDIKSPEESEVQTLDL